MSTTGWSGDYSDNLRLTLDVSSRSVRYSLADTTGNSTVVGLDLHKVFSGENGDIGTLTTQAYWTDNNNIVKHPGFFDDEDDNRLVYRIFNFNYSGFGINKPRVRIGHFEIPFGIEHIITTNGTLRNYTHGPNLGVKADWGISVNGETSNLEYEVAATRGGGQTWHRDNGDFVYAGRVGTDRSKNLVWGLSAYTSELGETTRNRFGIDAQWYVGLWALFSEVSAGDTNEQDVLNGLLEINRRSPSEQWLAYIQTRYFSVDVDNQGRDRAVQSAVGVRFTPDNHWALSAQYQADLSTFQGAREDRVLSLQLRYRF
ncbi:hypothetical protein FKG94_15455 [Exilibacterium tricleocarpae]|uniref:Porin n=1 Tax=Exilibacterium tricleocarpae TaxID=2591008 RepID=A0A545TFM9_9GAMM|nr:hypothetical protein [Exilibacterium tricleocarpae]TQV76005.1 hypothetical protein FKG94_15455 [Exilibacterium tricleocarpae]